MSLLDSRYYSIVLRGIKKIVAGGQFNLALSECPGTCYMWGQYTSSKEANMYPKPISDLSGWQIRSVGCSGKGWMVAADDSVIGCAPSPCFGELVSFVFDSLIGISLESFYKNYPCPRADNYVFISFRPQVT